MAQLEAQLAAAARHTQCAVSMQHYLQQAEQQHKQELQVAELQVQELKRALDKAQLELQQVSRACAWATGLHIWPACCCVKVSDELSKWGLLGSALGINMAVLCCMCRSRKS